ncbi:hypothetical protein B6U82_01370 [Candidatus Pacearchaeota archaeon ex4484_31]|nr:MAG: hypothetical protein B6U82_01370 [Candidatus Pacearchaeota archaeon ex4484_31]
MVLIKIHKAYREIVAVCDPELIGKKFEEGKRQLEVNEQFFKGKEMDEEEAIELLKEKFVDDACFNFVGENAVKVGIKAGLIDEKEGIMKIQGIPYALYLI